MYVSLPLRFVLGLMLFIAFLPSLSHAQASNADLRSTIRAELLSDPRTAGMSTAQIDAMVDALTQQAQKQGVTVHDITWRPATQGARAPISSCGSLPTMLCNMNMAFGLDGSNLIIPIALFVTSMLLILIIAYLLEHHYARLRAERGTVPIQQ